MPRLKYGIFQLMWLSLCVIVSRLFVTSKARIIRLPFTIIGKDKIVFGDGFSVGRRLRMECLSEHSRLCLGRNVKFNDDVHIGCIGNISIGNNVLMGSKVLITDHQHGTYSGDAQSSPDIAPDGRELSYAPVRIEDNVWIGEMVSIMPGVTIGYGAVVGAGSIVTKDIPARTIAVGAPCRPVKHYNEQTARWEPVL